MKSSHTWRSNAVKSVPETLISQPELRRLFGGISDMTIWRWRKSDLLPPPIVINRRNYYRASDIVDVQQRLAAQSGQEPEAT